MGFAKFGAVGGAGGAELVVWLRLRDELTKRLAIPEKAITRLNNMQMQQARQVATGVKKYADARSDAGRKTAATTIRSGMQEMNQIKGYIGISNQQSEAVKLQQQSRLGLMGVMGMGIMDWKKGREAQIKYTTTGGRLADRVRGISHGMRGFRMEMLGVMFFGMQLNKWMMGLLQPALQLSGVFDVFTATLEVLFLPIAMVLMDFLMPLFDWLMDLPEPVKLALGALVVFGAILGAGIMLIGQFALGIGSIIIAFGPLFGVFAGGASGSSIFSIAIGGIGAAFSALIPFILPVIIIIGVLLAAWSQNSEGIMKALNSLWEAFQSIFGGIWGIIQGFIDFIMAVFSLDAEKAFAALKGIAKSAIDLIIGLFIKLPASILSILWEIIVGIGRFVWKLPGFFVDVGSRIIHALVEGIMKIGGMIADALWSVIPEPFRGWIKGGVEFAGGIVGGVTEFFGGIQGWFAETLGMQRGGIVTRPRLAMIGERGPEAVIPLTGAGAGAGGNIIYFNPTISISIEAAAEVDIDAIKEKLSTEWVSELRGMLEG